MEKIKRQIEIEYIEGDVVAQDETHNLMVTGKGIMIADKNGNERFCSWSAFLERLKYLQALEGHCAKIHWVVAEHNS